MGLLFIFSVIFLAFTVLYLSPCLVAPTEDLWRDVRTASKERGNEDSVLSEIDSIIEGGGIPGNRKVLLKCSNLSLLTKKLIKDPSSSPLKRAGGNGELQTTCSVITKGARKWK